MYSNQTPYDKVNLAIGAKSGAYPASLGRDTKIGLQREGLLSAYSLNNRCR